MTFDPPVTFAALLSQWVDELSKLMLMRHNNMAARVRAPPQDMSQSQQAAMQIAQAAAAHAASHTSARQYHHG